MRQTETQPHYYTLAEYVALEAQRDVRHKYFEG